MPRGIFAKRAGKFMRALFLALNGDTFTDVSAISSPDVADEDSVNVESTVKILSDMEYVEVARGENGETTLRLTPSGVIHAGNFIHEDL